MEIDTRNKTLVLFHVTWNIFWRPLNQCVFCPLCHVLKTAKYKPAWTVWCLANQEVGKNLIVTIKGERISTILKSVKTCV